VGKCCSFFLVHVSRCKELHKQTLDDPDPFCRIDTFAASEGGTLMVPAFEDDPEDWSEVLHLISNSLTLAAQHNFDWPGLERIYVLADKYDFTASPLHPSMCYCGQEL
jgi:hypothetical protein